MRDESGLHLDLASEKLQAARDLMAQGHARDAASRAYYAMFHAGQALLRSRGLQAKTHRGLLLQLREHFQGEGGLSVHDFQAIRRGMEVREEGDYDVTFHVGGEELRQLLSDAEAFLARAQGLLGA